VVENFLEFRGGCFAIFGSQERVPAHKGRVEAGNVGDEDDSPNSMGDNGTLAAQEVDSQHLTSSGRLGGVAFTLAKPKSRISACPRSVRQRRAEVLGRRSDRGGVLGFIDDSHFAAAEALQHFDSVKRFGRAVRRAPSLRCMIKRTGL